MNVAVLPKAIRSKWDRLAIGQIIDRAIQLEDENAYLRRELSHTADCARMWEEIATIRDEHPNAEVGLTVDGRVVPVEPRANA